MRISDWSSDVCSSDLASDAINVGKDTVGQIKDVVATDFANGDYVEGTASILGDVVDGGLDLAGDTASGAVSWAGGTVENATDFTGSLVRDLGEFTGLQKPADAIAGVIESTGSTLSDWADTGGEAIEWRSEEHTSELQSLMRISYAVFCLKKKILITNYAVGLEKYHNI